MILKDLVENLISTETTINAIASTLLNATAQIKRQKLKMLVPGLVLTILDPETNKLDAVGMSLRCNTHDELLQMMESTLDGYADAKTQIVFFIFGAIADVDGWWEDEDEKHFGFVARGITIDGRSVVGFAECAKDDEGFITVLEDVPFIIETYADDDFEDGIMGHMAKRYVSRYNGNKEKKEKLH